ncbi:uncharacterized protein LOC111126122 [Crassostrea virginica]|uniref:Phospholipid scramblase n=1 Tax=Crassostrea virginica TaxID=6565 RepID=A0A8B8DEX1_CRAVI|nr:uncharacterized protein LOC111126122 [Crassostrea virginica]
MSQVNESGVDEAVITKQPSPQPNPTDSGGHQTQTTINTKRGNALEELEKLDKVILSQEISACKLACPCCIGRGAYTVHEGNSTEDLLFEIREAFVCLYRPCLGSARDFTSRLQDFSETDVVGTFHRGVSFRGCCITTCYPPELRISYPLPSKLGVVREKRTCCRPCFEILDGAGEFLYEFTNDCCYPQYCGWFMNYAIYVKDIEGETVALIVKKSYHNPEELIGIENKLHVEFVKKMKATEKLLVVSAALLVSLNNFEDSKRLCC